MDKSGIKNFAIEARNILRESAIKKAGVYGITIDHISDPIQKLEDSQVFQTIAGDEIRLYEDDLRKRNNLISAIKTLGFEQVIEETAYTWFNRLIAIRFMEVNDYLPSRIRVLSSEAGGSTPDIVTNAMEVDLNLSVEELDRIQKAKDENRYDDAFQMLFVKQCNELNAILPGLFEKTDDYMELLLDLSYTGDGVVRMLNSMIPEDDFNVEKQGQVEIIGWMYQYYNTELKDDTFAKLKKNIKITKERIPAATQLFTPDWIVRYMVENSLGRVWIDHLRAVDEEVDEKSKAEEFGWKYYLPEAEQEQAIAAELVKVRAEYKDLKPQDILCIDPCSGSGHILVYMFDVLMTIYESEGISERDAAFDILENNIYGLDIDKRAYQLSYFALMMKGRAAAGRRFFRGVEDENGERRQVELNVYAIDESNGVDKSVLDAFGVSMPAGEKEKARGQVETLLSEMHDAKEYGSIINVTDFDMELIKKYLSDREEKGQLSLSQIGAGKEANRIWKLAKIGKALAQKYDAVVTNPPYMGNSGYGDLLLEYVKRYFPDSKTDLFSVFVERCKNLTKKHQWYAMITQPSIVSLVAFEKLRAKIISNTLIQSFLYMGRGIFGIDFGSASFVIRNFKIKDYRGTYFRLHERTFQYIEPSDIQKLFMESKQNHDFKYNFSSYKDETSKHLEENLANNKAIKLYFEKEQDKFMKIPGNPLAFWLSDLLILSFSNQLLSSVAKPRQGLATGDNDRFLRMWHEVDFENIGFGISDRQEASLSEKKWFPCNKGGDYRKWYGNNDYIVDWENDGYRIRNNYGDDGKLKSRPQNMDYYFREGMTWSTISSKKLSMRLSKKGFMFETKGSVCFSNNEDELYYLLGLLNTPIVANLMSALSPTIDYHEGPLGKIPVIFSEDNTDIVKTLSMNNVDIAKTDWDSFETSWDFNIHPLVGAERLLKEKSANALINTLVADGCLAKSQSEIEKCFKIWDEESLIRFKDLKVNEEKLNKIFIDIYGLQDELRPDVEDKDITVRKADLGRDIRSLISYAVGCMFGRYSLDEEGLIYAGGDFDPSRYKTFPADEDAIIPITDEEYFDDDIVKRFVEFVQVVYGEDTLEENLQFIADALGNKGDAPREVIRNYFLNDFFKDHAKTYSVTGSGKRPIYWLFDSGKQNGFKCLIYMHRYTPDTVGLIRSVYLKKASDAIQKALDNAEYIIANTESNVDRAMSTKKRDKYVKQLAEIKPYYQALSHVAMQRIELDLDDGVKVNYAKFQGIEVGGDGEKKQTINLLAKI